MWLPLTAGLGVLAAWLAIEVQSYVAPLLVFPILVGIGVGAMNVALMWLVQMGHRPTAVAGVLLAVAFAIVGQHDLSYRRIVSASQRQIDAMAGVAPAGSSA